MVKTGKWISSDVHDEWVYLIPLNETEESDYNIRRASLFGASLELETLQNCEAIKMLIGMRNFLVDDDDEPVEVDGFVKSRDLSEKQKRKLNSMASDMGVEPYVVLVQNPATPVSVLDEASTLSEAREKATELRNTYDTDGQVYGLVDLRS